MASNTKNKKSGTINNPTGVYGSSKSKPKTTTTTTTVPVSAKIYTGYQSPKKSTSTTSKGSGSTSPSTTSADTGKAMGTYRAPQPTKSTTINNPTGMGGSSKPKTPILPASAKIYTGYQSPKKNEGSATSSSISTHYSKPIQPTSVDTGKAMGTYRSPAFTEQNSYVNPYQTREEEKILQGGYQSPLGQREKDKAAWLGTNKPGVTNPMQAYAQNKVLAFENMAAGDLDFKKKAAAGAASKNNNLERYLEEDDFGRTFDNVFKNVDLQSQEVITKKQRDTYNYLWNEKGKEAAYEYIYAILPELKEKKSDQNAKELMQSDKWPDRLGNTVGTALMDYTTNYKQIFSKDVIPDNTYQMTHRKMLKNMSEPEKWLHQNIYNTVQMLPGMLGTMATAGLLNTATTALPSASGALSKGAIAGKGVKTIMDWGQNIGKAKGKGNGAQAMNNAVKTASIDLAVSTLPGGEILGTVSKTLLKKLLDDPQRYVVYNGNNEAKWDNTKMLNDISSSLQGKNINSWLEYFLK